MSEHPEISWTSSCPFCGAEEDKVRSFAWRCGSRILLRDEYTRSSICQELCDLREYKETAEEYKRQKSVMALPVGNPTPLLAIPFVGCGLMLLAVLIWMLLAVSSSFSDPKEVARVKIERIRDRFKLDFDLLRHKVDKAEIPHEKRFDFILKSTSIYFRTNEEIDLILRELEFED